VSALGSGGGAGVDIVNVAFLSPTVSCVLLESEAVIGDVFLRVTISPLFTFPDVTSDQELFISNIHNHDVIEMGVGEFMPDIVIILEYSVFVAALFSSRKLKSSGELSGPIVVILKFAVSVPIVKPAPLSVHAEDEEGILTVIISPLVTSHVLEENTHHHCSFIISISVIFTHDVLL
jgi:hypothetical protein